MFFKGKSKYILKEGPIFPVYGTGYRSSPTRLRTPDLQFSFVQSGAYQAAYKKVRAAALHIR